MTKFLQGLDPLIDGKEKAVRTEISWGTVLSIDAEKQTMVVESGILNKPIELYINNAITTLGAGIRFMPIPGQTKVLLYAKDNIHFHLGYYFDNAKSVTDSKTFTKESAFLLQRYLDAGEVQFVGASQNEIFLENTGNIYIKSGANQFLKLDDIESLFEGNFGTLKFEMDEVRIRSGNVRRATSAITKEDQYVTELINNKLKYFKEFTVAVGALSSDTPEDFQLKSQTGVDLYPYDGFLSLASKVFNEQGTAETSLGKFLKFLLKFPTGVNISVSDDGALTILDQNNGNYLRFKTGHDSENNVPLTEFDIKLNKMTFKMNNSGEIAYYLEDPADANKKVNVDITKATSIIIKNTDDGSKYNTVTMNTAGTSIIDKNDNKVELTAAGTKVTDKNANEIEMISSKITVMSGGDKIEMGGGKIDITTAAGKITGGKLVVDGIAAPNGKGGFCAVPKCIFSGVDHISSEITGT